MMYYLVLYCNGYFVLIFVDIICLMYKVVFFILFFWVDDVYLYGLFLVKIGNVEFILIIVNLILN